MRILVVSATYKEIEQTLNFFQVKTEKNTKFYTISFLNNQIDFLIAGIGVYSTIYHLTKTLTKKKYDAVVNVGIAGSYKKDIRIGKVVNIITEEIGDLGVNDNGFFKTIFEEGFVNENMYPFEKGKLENPNEDLFEYCSNLPKVRALTLSTVSGFLPKIEELKNKFDVEVESMEGAAFFFVCLNENQPFVEIRSISNFVEPRSKDNWQIMKAISNLNETLRMFILELLKTENDD